MLAITFHFMPKNTDIQSYWANVPSAVEIAKRDVSVTGNFFFNRETEGIVFEKLT